MIMHHLRLTAIMSLMLIVSCWTIVSTVVAGSIGYPLTIYPLSDITADGPRVNNINPTHATLELITTIPVACAVVYGTDDAFGQVAIDPDMAGAAILEHRPVMGNLEPNTTYQYRMQGSDASGTLYVSEIYTFTTSDEMSQDINVASLEAGASILDVSSNWVNGSNDSSFGANKAIDNNENTAWASHADGDMASLTVQLVGRSSVHAIIVWSREMSDRTSRVMDFTVTSDVGEQFSFNLPNAEQGYRFDTPFVQPVTQLRFDVDTSTGGNVGLRDFDVLAPRMR